MRIKKALSMVCAGALAVAMSLSMSTSVFAGVGSDSSGVGTVEDGAWSVDLIAAGYDPTTVTGVDITFNVDDSDGFGGGFMTNGTPNSWHQEESNYWGDSGSNGPVYASGSDGTYTISFTVPDGEFDGAEDGYAQLVLQQWWGNSIDITAVNIKTSGAAAAADTSADASTDAGEAATVAKTADMAPTAGIVMIVIAAALIVVALKKRTILE